VRKLGAASVALALLGAGCGGNVIRPGATAQYVANFVLAKTGFRATDVRCPSGVPAKAGTRFECHFTGPEGPYTAYMKIVSVRGTSVLFNAKTQPSSWPPPKLP
jgi:Domain of unknown function (DUF4333)